MYLVTVLFLILIHNNLTASKSILFNRRNMDTTKQVKYEENDMRTQLNPSTQTNYNENHKSQMSTETQEKSTERNFNLTDHSEPIGSVRRLHPSDQLNLDKQPSSDTVEKKAMRENVRVVIEDVQRTTSEDTLQWLLSKKLPFMDPAPYNVGQREKGLMYPVTEGLWKFEGYDDGKSIKERVKDEFQDCEGQKLRCFDDTDYNQPVCVIDRSMPLFLNEHIRMKGFPGFCEVEYRNCLKRYEKNGKYYADNYNEDYLEFLHYGWCDQCGTAAFCV